MPKGKTGEFHSKDKRKLPIFIQSELDDYGLTCPEFRTYARIARRAGGSSKATESVPNMAEAFGVDGSTVRRALKVLCLCGLVSKKERPGWTPEYSLEDQDKWRNKSELKGIRESVLHPKKSRLTPMPSAQGGSEHQAEGGVGTTPTTPLSPDTDEGTPKKDIPEGTPLRARAQEPPQPETPEPTEELISGMIDFLEGEIGPLSNRSRETKAIKWLFEKEYDPIECEECLEYLLSEDWRTVTVTWVTVQKEIGNWKRRGSPEKYVAKQNGNGAGKDEYRGPTRSRPDPARESCQDCFGVGTVIRRGVAITCKHDGSTPREATA